MTSNLTSVQQESKTKPMSNGKLSNSMLSKPKQPQLSWPQYLLATLSLALTPVQHQALTSVMMTTPRQ